MMPGIARHLTKLCIRDELGETAHGLGGHELLVAGVQDQRRSLDQGDTVPMSLVIIKRTRRSVCPGATQAWM